MLKDVGYAAFPKIREPLGSRSWLGGEGMRGTVSTFALVPAVVDAIALATVVAADGIAESRGAAAALALSAQAARIGAASLAAEEADVHPTYREAVLRSGAKDTYYGSLYGGGWPNAPSRTLVSSA